jgi:hypothetical protein
MMEKTVQPGAMARSRPPSNRFLPQPESPLSRLRNAWGPQEVFAEGQWQTIRVGLESQGWSASQIERLHDQLRQGWPLSVAKQNVASLTRNCPVRSRIGEP